MEHLRSLGRAIGFFAKHLFIGSSLRALAWSESVGGRIAIAIPILVRAGLGIGFIRASITTDGSWAWPEEWAWWGYGTVWFVMFLQSIWAEFTAVDVDRTRLRGQITSDAVRIEATNYGVSTRTAMALPAGPGAYEAKHLAYEVHVDLRVFNPRDHAVVMEFELLVPRKFWGKQPHTKIVGTSWASRVHARSDSLVRVEAGAAEPIRVGWSVPAVGALSLEAIYGEESPRVRVCDVMRTRLAPVDFKVPGEAVVMGTL